MLKKLFIPFLFILKIYSQENLIKNNLAKNQKLKWQYEGLFSYYLYNKKESFLSGTIFDNLIKLKWQQSGINIFSKLDILSKKENNKEEKIINRFNTSLQYGSYFFSQKKIKFYFNLDYEYFEDEKSSYFNIGLGAKYNFLKFSKNSLRELSISFIAFMPVKFINNLYVEQESFFNNIIYSFRPNMELAIDEKFTLQIVYFLKYYQKEQNKISSELQIKPKMLIKKNFSFISSLSFLQYDIINEAFRYDINLYIGFKIN